MNIFEKFNRWDWAHGVYTLLFLLPILLIGELDWKLAAWPVIFYYGREMVDASNKAKVDRYKKPFSMLFVWNWHKASQLDFYSSLIAAIVMLVVEQIF